MNPIHSRLVVVLALAFAPVQIRAHPSSGIVVDGEGRVYFADTGRGVWRIDGVQKLSLIDSEPTHWMDLDSGGAFANGPRELVKSLVRITPTGAKPAIISCQGAPCTVGADGNIYFAKDMGVWRATPAGTQTVIVKNEQLRLDAKVHVGVSGMCTAPDGSVLVFVTDSFNVNEGTGTHAVLKVSMDGAVKLVARDFVGKPLPEDERPPDIKHTFCRGLCTDAEGNVFIAVTGSRCVMKLPVKGESSIILRSSKPWSPTGVAVFKGEVFVLEYDDETPAAHGEWPPRVRKIARDGTTETIAEVRRDGKKK